MPNSLNKILLADDEPHIRKFISLMVKSVLPDVEIIEADSHDTALASYKDEEPNLILLDINLIGKNGLETLKELKQINPNVKVIMLTSVNSRSVVEEAIKLKASGYILKGTPLNELKEKFSIITNRIFG